MSEKMQKNLVRRAAAYLAGFLVMTMGIACSVKSNLGVSPVSSIPYTMTCVWGIEMGNATILFHIALVLIQAAVLRRRFSPVRLLQIPVGIVFGKFTTMCNAALAVFPAAENIAVRIALMAMSVLLVAFGIFLYVPASFVPLAGEGCMGAVSEVTGIAFAKVKIAFDCTMVALSLATCLIFIHSLGSVGAGTVASAVLVGLALGVMVRKWGKTRDRILGI